MRITKRQLRRIIRETIRSNSVISEGKTFYADGKHNDASISVALDINTTTWDENWRIMDADGNTLLEDEGLAKLAAANRNPEILGQLGFDAESDEAQALYNAASDIGTAVNDAW